MPRQVRDHVYRSPREGERCRSRSHDKVWDEATGRKPICDVCGRCFWCADVDRCSGRRTSGVEPAGEGMVSGESPERVANPPLETSSPAAPGKAVA